VAHASLSEPTAELRQFCAKTEIISGTVALVFAAAALGLALRSRRLLGRAQKIDPAVGTKNPNSPSFFG